MNRRTFLTTTAQAAGFVLTSEAFAAQGAKPLLSFSTLGCPRWTLDQVLACAVSNGYQGIELRGLQGELDLPKAPPFSTAARATETYRLFADKRVNIINLGASTQLHHASPTRRTQELDQAKRFIELAARLHCPFVRVFPNDLPNDQDRAKTIELITSGLAELGQFAAGQSVSVLLESHGQVVESALLRQIMSDVDQPSVGLIWDIVNMWTVTNESPAAAYRALQPYIRHVHVKDVRMVAGQPQYTLLGEGEAPLAEAILALQKGSYPGYYSFEWEKRWHPDLPEPEVAFPHYVRAIQRYF